MTLGQGDVDSRELSPTEAVHTVPIVFDGRRGPLLRLVVVNSLLMIVTLSLYRFWAKTRLRRYFWSHVRIGTDRFEYVGLPSELVIGFLIVIASLTPALFVYASLDVFDDEGIWLLPWVLDVGYFVILYALAQVAIFSAWRYRMSRTRWRAIRFGMDGSAWRFLCLAILWSVAVVAMIGMAYPYLRIALLRYRINHSWFGNGQFSFEGTASELFASWLCVLQIPAVAIIWGALFHTEVGAMLITGYRVVPESSLPILPGVLFLLGSPLGYAWYRVKELRYLVGHTRFGAATFQSQASAGPVIGLILGVTGTFFILVAGGLFLLGLDGIDKVLGRLDVAFSTWEVLGMVSIVVGVLLMPILANVVLRFGILRHVCRSLTVANIAVFDRVAQSADKGPKRGEGLADALDVGTF